MTSVFQLESWRIQAIDDHHTQVKPVSAERKVRAEEESARAGAGRSTFRSFPTVSGRPKRVGCHLHLPFHLSCPSRLSFGRSLSSFVSFTFVHKIVYCRARPYRPATPPIPAIVAINIVTANNTISTDVSARVS